MLQSEMRVRLATLLVAMIVCAACHADNSTTDVDAAPSTSDTQSADAASSLGWESVETISNDGQVIVEDVAYRSDGLLIYGRVCRPAATGRYPVAMYNHGGFSGLGVDPTVSSCIEAARLGFVWLASSYRGEDASDGAVEVCLGEVDDVLRMLDIALVQPYADPMRAAMWGGSHGGCITMRALQRGAPVRAAAAIFGPADIARVHQYWQQQIGANAANASFLQDLATIVENATGGSPQTVPSAYAARSPQAFVADVPANVALLVTHGTADAIVPVTESCALAGALAIPSYHVSTTGQLLATAPVGCSQTWSTANDPRTTWPGARYFFAYDGLGHDVSGAAFDAMQQDVASFLLAKLR